MKSTITHYLNKKLKPRLIDNTLKYPVYVRVSYGRNNERIKSEWIDNPVSEIEFEDNEFLQNLKNYEREIIADILEDGNTSIKDMYLAARLRTSTRCVSECFFNNMLNQKEIKQQIINYICLKTNLSTENIYPYIRLDYIKISGWKELLLTGIFYSTVSQKLIYYINLLEFIDKYYPDTILESNIIVNYIPGETLVYHEWKKKGGKEKFLAYLYSSDILSSTTIESITKEFDKKLLEMSAFDIMVEYRRK